MKQDYDVSCLSRLDELAAQLAGNVGAPAWVYLQGDLGAGKTTFAQRFIAHKGYTGRVTSPTYALMQDYSTADVTVIHCDLYRLSEPEELYEIGVLEDVIDKPAIALVEWPEKGRGVLPSPDLALFFTLQGRQRFLRIVWAT